jgi:hypothetical protein
MRPADLTPRGRECAVNPIEHATGGPEHFHETR